MKNQKLVLLLLCLVAIISPNFLLAQNCSLLSASYTTTESRCANTGTATITASGGSGNYLYKLTGPIVTTYTSNNLISGLAPGNYLVTVRDIVTGCIYEKDSITVTGNYTTPTFTMTATGVTCINGNNGIINVTSTLYGRAPFSYRIIAPSASNVGVVSAAGTFTNLLSGNYLVQLRDSCGGIQTRSISLANYNWSVNSFSVTKIGCDSIRVAINLRDIIGNNTPAAIFNGFSYGASVTTGDTTWFSSNTFNYYIGKKRSAKFFAKDGCGNIKVMNWTNPDIPSVNSSVSTSNRACSTFTASITGQSKLTSPEYCIYNATNVMLYCNTTGVFNLLPYGSYCIRIRDICYDTTITRCFTANRPVPSVDLNVRIVADCNSATASITGQLNLNNPYYCLYDSNDVVIKCDSSGTFNSIPYGKYCIKVVNNAACYDTVITRCFTIVRPTPSVGNNVTTSNLTCSTFTASVNNINNLTNPQFCIYTAANILIACNTTGTFINLPYGTYCIQIENDPLCMDTTIQRCFTVARPIPSVNAAAQIGTYTCTGFNAAVTGLTNINNANFCLYNNLNVLVACNATGSFTNIPYGSYCIRVENDKSCYDTVISRCFTAVQPLTDITVSASKSCNVIGTTRIRVNLLSGIAPYNISLYSPSGTLVRTATSSSSSYTFADVANLAAPLQYKVVVSDNCGTKDSATITPNASRVNRNITATTKCPSALWPTGSADVTVDITDNNIGDDIRPKIIKKNGVTVSINPSTSSGYVYQFYDLGPGTYIFDTDIDDCDKHVYDTFTVQIYLYPYLAGSNAYSCDNSGFSLALNTNGGKSPYMYEIIGSTPATPSLITPPQSSPNFTINNGNNYSVVRARVLDACGNASLTDINVLPLSNFIVYQHNPECFSQSLMLRVDSVTNSTFTWYKRVVPNDSVVVGTTSVLDFSNLSLADTGRYFCIISIGNGCMIRIANHTVVGGCYTVLPNPVKLIGMKQDGKSFLTWNNGGDDAKKYILQKSENGTDYTTIHTSYSSNLNDFVFTDENIITGRNYYRLSIVDNNNKITYSNTVLISHLQTTVSIYPNPVKNNLYIDLKNKTPKNYHIELYSANGAKVISTKYTNLGNATIYYPISSAVAPGIYMLTITELQSNEKQIFKIIHK